jgi:hypothetical protein
MTPFGGVIYFLKTAGHNVAGHVLVLLYGFVLLLEALPEVVREFIRQRREGLRK